MATSSRHIIQGKYSYALIDLFDFCVSVLIIIICLFFFFFFQAEDGIRDWSVTGVQTCALPIYSASLSTGMQPAHHGIMGNQIYIPAVDPVNAFSNDNFLPLLKLGELTDGRIEIGRASCRERV